MRLFVVAIVGVGLVAGIVKLIALWRAPDRVSDRWFWEAQQHESYHTFDGVVWKWPYRAHRREHEDS